MACRHQVQSTCHLGECSLTLRLLPTHKLDHSVTSGDDGPNNDTHPRLCLQSFGFRLSQQRVLPHKTRAMETPLPLEDYARYGRQMILDGIGLPGKHHPDIGVLGNISWRLQGQLKLRNSSVVIIGAGGLGCPALQYLAAAGIGNLNFCLIDFSTRTSSLQGLSASLTMIALRCLTCSVRSSTMNKQLGCIKQNLLRRLSGSAFCQLSHPQTRLIHS